MICTESELQPLLPQVMIVGAKVLRKQDVDLVRAALPQNVYVLRRESGWNNTEVQTEIVKLTQRVLEAHLHRYQVIWMSDACTTHMAPEVMRAIGTAGFWYCIIPANLTWLLQPLDVVTFVLLKRFIKNEFTETLGEATEHAKVIRMIGIVVIAIRKIFQARSWVRAFAYVGAMGAQGDVTGTLKVELGWEAVPEIPRNRPTNVDIARCLPRRLHIEEALHRLCMPPEPGEEVPGGDGPGEAAEAGEEAGALIDASAGAAVEAGANPEGIVGEACRERVGPWHRLRQKTRSWVEGDGEEGGGES